jgi:hypothetical protein
LGVPVTVGVGASGAGAGDPAVRAAGGTVPPGARGRLRLRLRVRVRLGVESGARGRLLHLLGPCRVPASRLRPRRRRYCASQEGEWVWV